MAQGILLPLPTGFRMTGTLNGIHKDRDLLTALTLDNKYFSLF